MSYFGINIKKLRRLKSLSQTELAELIGLKRGALGAYEEGRSEPKIETIIRVANIFSISIDGLLTRELSINELLNFDTALTTDESQLRKAYPKIPFITKSFYDDYIKYHHKDNFITTLPFIQWPVDDDFRTYRFYEVSDLEMSNGAKGFYPKDVLLFRKVDIGNLSKTIKALVVYEDLKFRNIRINDNECVLYADHPVIDDIILDKESLKEVWKLVGAYQKHRVL